MIMLKIIKIILIILMIIIKIITRWISSTRSSTRSRFSWSSPLVKRWLSFENADDCNSNQDDDDDADSDADNHNDDEHDALAGDDPPVAIPGCSTKASQLQVYNILIYWSQYEGENNNCFNFSKKSSEILNEYFYSHLSNPYPR